METLKNVYVRMYLAARDLRDREEGQAMVEYALILSMVSVGAITVLSLIGGNISSIFSDVNAKL